MQKKQSSPRKRPFIDGQTGPGYAKLLWPPTPFIYRINQFGLSSGASFWCRLSEFSKIFTPQYCVIFTFQPFALQQTKRIYQLRCILSVPVIGIPPKMHAPHDLPLHNLCQHAFLARSILYVTTCEQELFEFSLIPMQIILFHNFHTTDWANPIPADGNLVNFAKQQIQHFADDLWKHSKLCSGNSLNKTDIMRAEIKFVIIGAVVIYVLFG